MSIITYTGPKVGTPEWRKYWMKKTKGEIIFGLTLYAKLQVENAALREALTKIADVTPDKMGAACPVCHTYTHKGWCWYPELMRLTNSPLDEHDSKFLELCAKLPEPPKE